MKAKVSAVMWWVGPLAILGAMFAVISDQIGLFVALGGLAGEFAVYALVVEPGSLPGGAWAAWAG